MLKLPKPKIMKSTAQAVLFYHFLPSIPATRRTFVRLRVALTAGIGGFEQFFLSPILILEYEQNTPAASGRGKYFIRKDLHSSGRFLP